MRSLFLNYEVMALLYGEREIRLVTEWFEALRASTATGLPEVSGLRAVAEDIAHLLGPLV